MLRESQEIEVSFEYGDFDGTKEYHKVKFRHSSPCELFTMYVDGNAVLSFSDADLKEFKELVNSLWY